MDYPGGASPRPTARPGILERVERRRPAALARGLETCLCIIMLPPSVPSVPPRRWNAYIQTSRRVLSFDFVPPHTIYAATRKLRSRSAPLPGFLLSCIQVGDDWAQINRSHLRMSSKPELY